MTYVLTDVCTYLYIQKAVTAHECIAPIGLCHFGRGPPAPPGSRASSTLQMPVAHTDIAPRPTCADLVLMDDNIMSSVYHVKLRPLHAAGP